MSVSTLAGNQASALGLIQGTDATQNQSVSAVAAQGQTATQTVTDTLDQGAGTQALASPAAMSMNQLQNLAKSDPTRFKAVTQKISDQLATEAKSASNPEQEKLLSGLSGKFAEASKSGSMSSLEFHKGAQQHGAIGKYSGQRPDAGTFNQVGSIISSALASTGASESATASTSAGVAGVAASGGAEA
ncbi:MAG: hypothetical protein HQK81_14355 [Desulfovibrionaceae bacterium]|nr:hypothetical protein [Desulfovibrionaceae bacterium]MBF0515226.1 hypothetical protein [Desulfovibrionaceae bacterium]